jgi:tetratricopeptide (TPR) repeat protein
VSDDSEKWQWVDEDPIEKLLQASAGAVGRVSPATSPTEEFIAVGRAQFEQLRFEEAAGSFSAAVAAEPDHPAAHFDPAVCLEKLEQWKAAALSFRRALEIGPGLAQALIGLGACLLHLNGAEQALACFEQCLEWGAEPERALLGKAVALQQLSRYEEADPLYRELLETDPGAAEPLANLIALSAWRVRTPRPSRSTRTGCCGCIHTRKLRCRDWPCLPFATAISRRPSRIARAWWKSIRIRSKAGSTCVSRSRK